MPRLTCPLVFALACLCAGAGAEESEGPLRAASAHLASGNYMEAIAVLEQGVRTHTPGTLDLLCRAYRARMRQLIESRRYEEARRLAPILRGYEKQLRRAAAHDVAATSMWNTHAGTGDESKPDSGSRHRRSKQAPLPHQRPQRAPHPLQADGWRPVGSSSSRPRSQPAVAAKQPKNSTPRQAAQVTQPTRAHPAAEARAIADAAFSAGDYARALKAYGEAYRANPNALDRAAIRRWSYCRLKQAVDLLNRGPRNDVEWSLLEEEVQDVVRLLESHSAKGSDELLRYAYFLLRVTRARQAPERKNPDMIRAAEPEPRGNGRQRTRSHYPAEQSRMAPLRRLWPASHVGGALAVPLSNSVTPFRVRCSDPELAARLMRELPRIRENVAVRLFGSGSRPPWPVPCLVEVRSDPNPHFSLAATTPAVTTIERDEGRIRSWRIDLYRWTPRCLETVLAHEVAHVWLAAASPGQPIPPWADEGIAVLMEPRSQYLRHLRRLANPMSLTLRSLEHPDTTDVGAFYAAAASLADCIRAEFGMAKLLQVARRSATVGIRAAAREQLGLSNIEARWRAHVARQLAKSTRLARADVSTANARPHPLHAVAAH